MRPKSVNTRVWHKSVNTPLSHERLVVRTWLAVYALPPTTINCDPGAWDKGVLTDLYLTRVLTDLCLTLYYVCIAVLL